MEGNSDRSLSRRHRGLGPIGTLRILMLATVAAGFLAAPPELGAGPPPIPKTNLTTDITDAWWPDDEPGWGVQFAHNTGIVFATLYVYDSANRPTFYVAVLSNLPPGSGVWTGPLSSTTGPHFAGPFDPAVVVETIVGTMTFTRTGLNDGVLTYNVGAAVVAKSVARQPFALEDNTGEYDVLTSFGGYSGISCGVDNAPPANVGRLSIVQAGDGARLVFEDWAPGIAPVCLVDPATYLQAGRYGRYLGTFVCEGSARHANVLLFDIANSVRQLSGRYQFARDDGCMVTGRFAAISTAP
ncbi:MAG: hypothetical protein J0L91_01285 [Burkholderiales bacterium]|nr:hypothetical protein [Burkholderiales bacterium]